MILAEIRLDGVLKATECAAFTKAAHFVSASRALEIDKDALMGFIDRLTTEAAEHVLDTPAKPVLLHVRGRLQPGSASVPFTGATVSAALSTVLSAVPSVPEPLVLWDDPHSLTALDVDYHGVLPTLGAAALIERVKPRPLYAWQTHGGGARMLYIAQGSLQADELAALGALHTLKLDPSATVELKTDTRHPLVPVSGRSCGPVRLLTPDADTVILGSWLGEKNVSEEAVAEWLECKGFAKGQRYPHTDCPVAPREHGNRDPVCVRDDGIYCHVCNGRGVTYGHKIPGWFPYTAFLGSVVPGQVATCVRCLTHWEHARYVLQETFNAPEPVLQAAYVAACKVLHGADSRIDGLRRGKEFVRFDRRWATCTGETYTEDVAAILARLPACQFTDADGAVHISAETLARFQQPIDLAKWGYPALSPIWGVRIFSHRLPLRDTSKVSILLQKPQYTPEAMRGFRATYVPVAHREYDEEAAWQILEEVFPGVSRDAVKLLVAAKGVAEGEVGLPPMIFLTGPTGAAKTGSIALAAGICGDSVHSVPWSSNIERVRAALLAAKEEGSYAVFNEIVKEANYGGRELAQAFTFLLNLTPDSLSHKLYVGPVHLGSLPVVCLTDTSLPVEISQHGQLARRLTAVRLPGRLAWEDTLRDYGISNISLFRLADPRFAAAANVLLSVIIDTFFQYPMTFEEISTSLGFQKLEASEAMSEKRDSLRDLFKLTLAAPELEGSDATRWKGRGWKLIAREHQTDLAECWRQICDSEFITSEKCNETDWAGLLGLTGPILCELRAHGKSRLAIRFVRRTNRTEYLVNGELQ